jgi:hypothetical protein
MTAPLIACDPMPAPFIDDAPLPIRRSFFTRPTASDRIAPAKVGGAAPHKKNIKFNGFVCGHWFPPFSNAGFKKATGKNAMNQLNDV